MREIKFRAFHKEAKEMYWFDVMNGNHSQGNGYIGMALFGEPITKERYRDRMILVDPMECEIMQYTGLKDKNGVEIYEGDIIFNSNRTLLTLKEDKRLYLVKWQDAEYNEDGSWLRKKPSFIFEKLVTDNKKYMDLIFSKEQIEVIGNIYQNPELL